MTASIDRRSFVEGAGVAAIASLAASGAQAATSQQPTVTGKPAMTYDVKPLPFDPAKLSGLSEKLIVSHHDNNYAGAVKRLNAITAQLAALDWATAPTFVVNGLKREELIAANSMILHEHYFNALGGDGVLGKEGDPSSGSAVAITRDFGSVDRWRAEFSAMATSVCLIHGLPITPPRSRAGVQFWCSICTNMPTTWISVPRQRHMWMRSWPPFAGISRRSSISNISARHDGLVPQRRGKAVMQLGRRAADQWAKGLRPSASRSACALGWVAMPMSAVEVGVVRVSVR